MNEERKTELLESVRKALQEKKATNEEVWQLFGEQLFWAFHFGRYDQITLHRSPEKT